MRIKPVNEASQVARESERKFGRKRLDMKKRENYVYERERD